MSWFRVVKEWVPVKAKDTGGSVASQVNGTAEVVFLSKIVWREKVPSGNEEDVVECSRARRSVSPWWRDGQRHKSYVKEKSRAGPAEEGKEMQPLRCD